MAHRIPTMKCILEYRSLPQGNKSQCSISDFVLGLQIVWASKFKNSGLKICKISIFITKPYVIA